MAIARALCGDLNARAPPSEVLGLDVSPLLSIHMGFVMFAGGTGRAARRSTGSGGALRGRNVQKFVRLERWGRGPRELGALRGGALEARTIPVVVP